MATPFAAGIATARCSPSRALQVANGAAHGAALQPPTTLAVLEPQPQPTELEAPVSLDLPRIVASNAATYPPPSLNSFRTAAARAPANSAPACWYWQLTGDEWQRDGHSYELAKKRYKRMLAEHKAAERERESKRDRSSRKRPADDCAQAARRMAEARKKKAELAHAQEMRGGLDFKGKARDEVLGAKITVFYHEKHGNRKWSFMANVPYVGQVRHTRPTRSAARHAAARRRPPPPRGPPPPAAAAAPYSRKRPPHV